MEGSLREVIGNQLILNSHSISEVIYLLMEPTLSIFQ